MRSKTMQKYNILFAVFLALLMLASSVAPAAAQSGPSATPEMTAALAAAGATIPEGPFEPTWDSLNSPLKKSQRNLWGAMATLAWPCFAAFFMLTQA
jgi:hypothetical protein